MSRLFSGSNHAKIYKQFRPVYPSQVMEKIVDYCRKFHNSFNLALDLGCGSGQSTLPLAKYFNTVIGVDASQSQITEARKFQHGFDNVQYQKGHAENVSFQANDSVDLITVASAFHWMNTDKFYCEANRVLRPGGVAAIYCYGTLNLDYGPSNDLIIKLENILWANSCWHSGRKHVNNLYADFTPMPLDDFCRDDSLVMTQHITIDDVIGFLSTWSGYQTFMKTFPGSTILEDVASHLYTFHGGGQCKVELKRPIFILMGHKKF